MKRMNPGVGGKSFTGATIVISLTNPTLSLSLSLSLTLKIIYQIENG